MNATLDVLPNGKSATLPSTRRWRSLQIVAALSQVVARDPGGLEALAGIFIEARKRLRRRSPAS